ncbi:hypothetical protein GDO81_007097 [Engystomops pustulosus]|uniref:SEA domain-containing protein n=1 Tax=Engystomops pustulosus TaxID=76066 RepID=A0AAV7C4V9_ENGPU|nr:hypothetical protein GDO81_007097 [Engystomops pustulosus]
MTILSSIPYLFIIHLSLDISSGVKAEDQEDISYEPIFRINDPGSFVREKREAALPTNYEVDIEISFPDYSMASAITSFLEDNLKTLFLDNSTTVSSVDVAPACNLSGSVATCSCQKDYDCLGAQDPLTNTCTTTLPLQRYCRPHRAFQISPFPQWGSQCNQPVLECGKKPEDPEETHANTERKYKLFADVDPGTGTQVPSTAGL